MPQEAPNRNHIINLSEKVGRLEGKVDQMDNNITQRFLSLEARIVEMHHSIKKGLGNHGDRIRALERNTTYIKGKAAGIALAVSAIISILGLLISYLRGLF